MITRYTRPEMGRIWSDENKFRAWLEVELAASETLAEMGEVPPEAARLLRQHAHAIGKRLAGRRLGESGLHAGGKMRVLRQTEVVVRHQIDAPRQPHLTKQAGLPYRRKRRRERGPVLVAYYSECQRREYRLRSC